MTRSNRMKRISDLAELSKKTASQRLEKSQRKYDGDRERLEEFRRYRLEYTQALTDGTAITASAARELRKFIGQLDRTIAALEAQVDLSARNCETDRNTWQKETRRTRALADVLDRCQREDNRRDEQAGQRESDERGAPDRRPGGGSHG